MWQQKGLEVGIPLLFFLFARDFGLAHEIPDIFLPLLLAHWPLARPAKHTRAYTDSPFPGRLKPFPRFYILDEIPAALCPFITFANQMMSLDILRLDFIVAFYAGRTASVKRIRAERSRLIGYHTEIRSLSCSRLLDRQPYGLFLLFLTAAVRTSYTVLLPFYCRIFRGNFPCEITSPCTCVSFYDKSLCVTCISNATKPVQGIHG